MLGFGSRSWALAQQAFSPAVAFFCSVSGLRGRHRGGARDVGVPSNVVVDGSRSRRLYGDPTPARGLKAANLFFHQEAT